MNSKWLSNKLESNLDYNGNLDVMSKKMTGGYILTPDEYVGEVDGHLAKDDPKTLELLIIIHPKARGKNYAKAATMEYMKRILKIHPDIEKFRLEIAESNTSSKSVAQKLDFEFSRYKDEKNSEKMEYWEKDAR